MKLRGLIVASTVALTVLAVQSVAMAGPLTATRIYRAFTSSGAPAIGVSGTVSGRCFSGSIQANRSDAWRCTSASLLYDPCFSASNASGIVLCPAAPWERAGVKMILTSGLPTKFSRNRPPSTNVRPWAMETTSGAKCLHERMGPLIGARRVGDYACTNGKWLWNLPDRTAQPWTMAIAPVTATKLTTRAGIAVAWF